MGGIHLLDACVAAGVKRIVFASTGGAIYGEVPEARARRRHPTRAREPLRHPQARRRAAAPVYRKHRGLRARLRYANVYGPRQDPHGEAGVVAIFFASALEGRPLR